MSDSLIYGLFLLLCRGLHSYSWSDYEDKSVGFSISKESKDDLILTNYPIRLLQISDKTSSIQVTHVE